MAFYYSSLFNFIPLGIAYAMLALVFLVVVRLTRGALWRKTMLAVIGAVVVVLPVSEELWIAWSFGRACEQAGTFIHRKVTVEGFYDETSPGSLDLVRPDGYRFVEGKTDKGYVRLSFGDARFMQEALARFAQENPDKDLSKQDVVRVKLDARTEALAYPQKGESWKIVALHRPTARYRFQSTDPMSGTPWGHKVGRSGASVIDTQTNEEIARYTSFGREPPWYYIGLGVAPFACDAPRRWPTPRGNPLIYRDVLIPEKAR